MRERGDKSLEGSAEKLRGDLALFWLADAEARDWAAQWGGATDGVEMYRLRAAMEGTATKLLDRLLALPIEGRRAIAFRLRTRRKALSPQPEEANAPGGGV